MVARTALPPFLLLQTGQDGAKGVSQAESFWQHVNLLRSKFDKGSLCNFSSPLSNNVLAGSLAEPHNTSRTGTAAMPSNSDSYIRGKAPKSEACRRSEAQVESYCDNMSGADRCGWVVGCWALDYINGSGGFRPDRPCRTSGMVCSSGRHLHR